MRDKIAGALYGMALGDAMGMPAELWGRKRVKAFFGRIEGFLDGPAENDVAFNYKKGQFTDDTGPVSYTHLDVYKRQLLGILSHIYKNARFLTKIAFFVKILTDCKIILCGI